MTLKLVINVKKNDLFSVYSVNFVLNKTRLFFISKTHDSHLRLVPSNIGKGCTKCMNIVSLIKGEGDLVVFKYIGVNDR